MSRLQLHPLSLRFLDPTSENAFVEHDRTRLVLQGRVALLVAISTYIALGVLFDPYLFPESVRSEVWLIRGLALSGALAVLLLTTHRLFARFNYLPLAGAGLSGGLGLIAMSLLLPSEQIANYYPALILVAFFTYNFVGTRFIYALAVDLSLFALYNLALLSRGDVPAIQLGLHDFYILTANLIGGGAGYLTELQRRQLFCGELQLREQIQQAEQLRRQADQANAAKSRFLAAVSHDLRQPIHAQGMFLSVLGNTALTPKQREIIANLGAATQASGEMLHTLMDFSRIEAGTITPQFTRFKLQPLFNKIENEFIGQADAKRLDYRSRETELAVCSDAGLLEIILRNLVTNAIRYTRRGGILLACRRRGDHALIEVYDTGIGIPPEQQQEVFREFHQLGNPERDRQKGLGLGLAIVKGLAECLDHPLALVSLPGRGSIFRLRVPLAQTLDLSVEGSDAPLPAQLPPLNVLLIDDDEFIRASSTEQLKAWSFRCQAVDGIERALALARKNPPDLIISDFRLREHRTGAEAIQLLRRQAGYPVPALLITGDTSPERIREAQACGVPLLHKPLAPSELYRQIARLLEGRW